MKKIYYEIKLMQRSPLRIGAGETEETDSDIVLDRKGLPFVPGSSLAGVLRSLMDSEAVDKVFGDEKMENESSIIISDATLVDEPLDSDIAITIRDGIELDEWGVTVKGHKYDFQVVESKIPYRAVLELESDEVDYEELVDRLVNEVCIDGLSFGARTSRGYGRMDARAKKRVFEFPQNLDDWLEFDPFDKNSFTDCEEFDNATENISNTKVINVSFHVKDTFAIRVSTARSERLDDGTIPDSVPLLNKEGKPVITGTSWAGSFRHHMNRLVREMQVDDESRNQCIKDINNYFGVMEGDEKKRSSIAFSETSIEGGKSEVVMRNAVDRFTQATRNGALFTSQVWKGGKGVLSITLGIDDSKINRYLAMTLMDMDMGLLSFGGEASIGRGLMEIDTIKVNGNDRTKQLKTHNDIYFLEG